jgi:hypothetical protein
MNPFSEALVSSQKNPSIPEDRNYFGQFVGEWDFDWYEGKREDAKRHVKGEWIFSWVLDGTAVQDVFICPSRAERLTNPQPDGEYGTTIRFYNPNTGAWDIFYGCTGEASRLEARKEKDEIVLTEVQERKMKWIFSEITENSFHWRHMRAEDGQNWEVRCEFFAVRRK